MRPALILTLLAACLAGSTARAATIGERVMNAGQTIGFVELGLPDLRLSLGGERPRVALAWPLMVGLGDVWFGLEKGRGFRICGGCSELANALFISAFLEPQWAPWSQDARGLFGFRTLFHRDDWLGATLAFDAGGLGAASGPGGFVGAYAGAEVFGIALLFGGRRVWLAPGAEWELAIDLMVPMQWLTAG